MNCETLLRSSQSALRGRKVILVMTQSAIDRSVFSRGAWLRIADTTCLLQSSHPEFATTLAPWIKKRQAGEQACDFTLRVQVNDAWDALEPVHFRGSAHLVIAQYGSNVFLFDLHRKTVEARISQLVSRNTQLWADRFLPLILGVLGPSVGVLPLHSACVVKGGRGILIAGASTAGKSTLSVALAKSGFALLSDDWTYIRARADSVLACGLQVPVKLLPDAVQHFPELRPLTPVRTGNGEIAFEGHADEMFHVPVAARCTPSAFVFLERVPEGWPEMVPALGSFVQEYVNNSVERLPKELATAIDTRDRLIDSLRDLPCWTYRYSGTPQAGADYLARFFARHHEVIEQ
jgi:hypothetical protein